MTAAQYARVITLFLASICFHTGCVTTPAKKDTTVQAEAELQAFHMGPLANPPLVITCNVSPQDTIKLTSAPVIELTYQASPTIAVTNVLLGIQHRVGDKMWTMEVPQQRTLSPPAGKIDIGYDLSFLSAFFSFQNAVGEGDLLIALYEALPPAVSNGAVRYGQQLSNPVKLRIKR